MPIRHHPYRRTLRSGQSYAAARRSRAASLIQSAFRRRRNTRRGAARFSRRVLGAVRRNEPCQYGLGGVDGLAISITPQIVTAYSKLPYSQDVGTNVKFCRTSQKVFAKQLTCSLKVKLPYGATSDNYNTICLAFIRYKRSQELRNADLQSPGIGGGPLTDSDDKPFLPCQRAAAPYFTAVPLNMTTTAVGSANPRMLQNMWNPKVVDVIKKWNITLQQQKQVAGYPVTYPFLKQWNFIHKFNETWKYANDAPPAVDPGSDPPYNNKNYYLIAWSDSSAPGHPYLTTSQRVSFKDQD